MLPYLSLVILVSLVVSHVYMQWLPYNYWQIVYIIWRFFLAVYFFGWLVVAGVERGSWLFLIYLTDWCFIGWVLYLAVAASSTLIKFIFHMRKLHQGSSSAERNEHIDLEGSSGVSSDENTGSVEDIYIQWRVDNVAWYQKVQWFVFNLGPHLQVIAVILYWGLVYDPSGRGPFHSDPVNFHIHLVGGIVAIIDVWIAGVVMNIYHFYEVVIFGVTYTIFTVIYYAADGRDQYGNRYIYSVLDYGSNPGLAVGIALSAVFILAPATHFFLYFLSLLRRWLAAKLHSACFKE